MWLLKIGIKPRKPYDRFPAQEKKAASHTPRPFVDLLVSILIPSVVLMKFSNENSLGASGALIIALAFR